MNIAIVYDSRTGTTRAAAHAMGATFERHGHACSVLDVSAADPRRVEQADCICVGTWTQGLFLFAQRPTRATMTFIRELGDLEGKKAIAFCTYKLATGSLLPNMTRALERKGAEVIGSFKYRGIRPGDDFAALVATLTPS